jgi:hypothetical protein
MRYAMKSFWILFFMLMALALGRCGRLSNSIRDIASPAASEIIPEGWDGSADWSENALKVEDITP